MAVEAVRIEGLEGVLKTLKSLPPEVVSKRGGPVRFALRKAAVLIQKQAIVNLDHITATPNEGDLPHESTGLLKANVMVTRGKAPAGGKGETFRVRIRNKPYPQVGNAKKVTTAQVGRLLEYGTSKRQPYPWIRPAFESKKNQALSVFTTEVVKKIAQIQKKLERQNGVRK